MMRSTIASGSASCIPSARAPDMITSSPSPIGWPGADGAMPARSCWRILAVCTDGASTTAGAAVRGNLPSVLFAMFSASIMVESPGSSTASTGPQPRFCDTMLNVSRNDMISSGLYCPSCVGRGRMIGSGMNGSIPGVFIACIRFTSGITPPPLLRRFSIIVVSRGCNVSCGVRCNARTPSSIARPYGLS